MNRPGANIVSAWADELLDLEQQIEQLQADKRECYREVREQHGKVAADALKASIRLHRMDEGKRQAAEQVDAETARMLAIIEASRAPRATRTHEDHSPDAGNMVTEPQLSARAPAVSVGETAAPQIPNAAINDDGGQDEDVVRGANAEPNDTRADAGIGSAVELGARIQDGGPEGEEDGDLQASSPDAAEEPQPSPQVAAQLQAVEGAPATGVDGNWDSPAGAEGSADPHPLHSVAAATGGAGDGAVSNVGSAPAAVHVNHDCLKHRRGEPCLFSDKVYSCSDCRNAASAARQHGRVAA